MGLLSGSTLAYIDYYNQYQQERSSGTGYRESIRRVSQTHGVSETTVKKAIRLFRENDQVEDSSTREMNNLKFA
jgi:transposase-like protein